MPFEFKFLGDCYNIAIALNQKFNLPICVLYGERWDDHSIERILIHVGVVCNNNFFDEIGLQGSPEDVLDSFIQKNEIYNHTSIKIYKSSNDQEFIKLIKNCGGKINTKKINFFKFWIEDNLEKFYLLLD